MMRITRSRWWCAALVLASSCFASRSSFAEEGEKPVSPLVRVDRASTASYAKGAAVTQTYRSLAGVKRPLAAEQALTKEILHRDVPQFFATTLRAAKLDSQPDVAVQIGKNWFVHQQLAHAGIPLASSSAISVMVRDDGTPVFARERNIPTRIGETKPTLTAKGAIDVALAEAKRSVRLVKLQVTEPELELWVDGERTAHLSWRCDVGTTSTAVPFAQRMWIAATGEPRVLAVENRIYHVHKVRVTGTAWDVSPLRGTKTYPLANQEVELVKNGQVVMKATTNQLGEVTFEGTGPVEVRAKLHGMYCVVKDLSESDLSGTETGNDKGAIELHFDANTETELSQITAFYWTNVAENLAHEILATAPQHPLARLATNVNIDQYCNAFWNGSSINFFRAGNGCANTAYRSIILHEYGHGIDDRIGGIVDGGYSEGFGDAVSMLVTRSPVIGEDFLGENLAIRDGRRVVKWPPEDPEVHAVGEIYNGFVWELLLQLRKNHSEDDAYAIAKRLVMSAAAANPADIPDAVRLSFLADDDDGDLANGSPSFKELASAADSRTIPRPEDPATDD